MSPDPQSSLQDPPWGDCSSQDSLGGVGGVGAGLLTETRGAVGVSREHSRGAGVVLVQGPW